MDCMDQNLAGGITSILILLLLYVVYNLLINVLMACLFIVCLFTFTFLLSNYFHIISYYIIE